MEKGYGKVLSILLVIAIILIIGILGFFAFRIFRSGTTNKNGKDIVAEFDINTPTIPSKNNNIDENNEENNEGISLDDIIKTFGENTNNSSNQQSGKKKATYYKGYKVIGTISIPSINIEYPILNDYSSETLKIAIVAVYPNDAEDQVNKPGNLVLWGHNYKDDTFFSKIGELKVGAKIYIKDTDGVKLTYQVYNVYETTDSDSDYTRRDTEGKVELSLSTCTAQSGRRTIVWARAVE